MGIVMYNVMSADILHFLKEIHQLPFIGRMEKGPIPSYRTDIMDFPVFYPYLDINKCIA